MVPDIYDKVIEIAGEIEAELKRLNRWSSEPLPPKAFENMGAFGSNTMAFEQWIQFVLILRLHEIVKTKGEFPENSQLATYAVRAFDGDTEADRLCELLYELDGLVIGRASSSTFTTTDYSQPSYVPPSITYGSDLIPDVVYQLIDVLPQFTGEDLESQLQTYDMFLSMLAPTVRPIIAKLLDGAASKTLDEVSRLRIQQAAKSVAEGGRAAELYNHDEAMKKYKKGK